MNHKQQAFVTQYLKFGDQMIAYKNAYQSKADNKTLQSAANRLMNHPEVSQAIYDAESRIRADVERQVAARRAKEILTIEEKLILLQDIATGNIYVEQHYKGKNCTQCSQNITSSINQRLAALRDHSKLAGHYPHKQNGKWIIPALAEQQEENIEPDQTTSPLGSNTGPCPPQADEATREEQNTENLQHNATNIELSPAGGGGAAGGGTTREEQETGLSASGVRIGGHLAEDKETKAEKTQHFTTTESDTHEEQETDLSASGVRIGGHLTQDKEAKAEKTQQNTTTIELSPAGGGGSANAESGVEHSHRISYSAEQSTQTTNPHLNASAVKPTTSGMSPAGAVSASGVRIGGQLAHENHRNQSWNLTTEKQTEHV